MSKYVSKQNLNTIVQEMGKKIPSILNLTNEELQEIIDAFNPEFVPYDVSDGIPVGTLFPYAADTNTPPTGFLFCNGQAVSRTMYADLFSVLGTTWGAGDGSTTFNLPTSEDLVLQGASTTNPVGTYLSAGLPNIEGVMRARPLCGALVRGMSPQPTGAFKEGSATTYSPEINTSDSGSELIFDASQSNSIYGASDTVQPPAACVKFIIKAYDGVTPGSAGIDLSQYASDLSNKADRSLSNLNGNGEQKLTDTTESVVYEDGFAIIYPNGGSEGSPANITVNTRYVETNPFPGYLVKCQAEVLVDGDWVEFTWIFGSNPAGAYASQLNDTIVLQTLRTFLVDNAVSNTGMAKVASSNLTTAAGRIKVWKIGKVASA